MKSRNSQRGIGLIENMVAIALLGISMVGATSLFINSFHSNAASRTYTSLISDVHTIIDEYRRGNYSDLLDKFPSSYTAITNGQTAQETTGSPDARATYTTTFTAIKTSTTNIPEAVRIQIRAVQRRGKFGDATYQFETMIAQTR